MKTGVCVWKYVVIVGILSAGFLSGCSARLTAVPVSERARLEMGADNGIPYYVPRPYLLVTRNVQFTDEELIDAGMVPEDDSGLSSVSITMPTSASPAPASGTAASTSATGASSSSSASSTNASTSPASAPSPSGHTTPVSTRPAVEAGSSTVSNNDGVTIHATPTYKFEVIYLPDLTRQYALQQRGGAFSNVSLKYELEGGWMFKGTEISAETQVPAAIEATTSGLANILGSSMETVFTSLFPPPITEDTSGVSGISANTGRSDMQPKIWLFEIADGPRGTLRINTERPFFEWPPDSSKNETRRAVESIGRDPEASDLFPVHPVSPSAETAPVSSPRSTTTPSTGSSSSSSDSTSPGPAQ